MAFDSPVPLMFGDKAMVVNLKVANFDIPAMLAADGYLVFA